MLLSNSKLTTSSGKHLEDINHSHIVSLLYQLITSIKDSNDLSIGFDRSRNRRKDEMAQNKNAKGKYHLRIMLKDVFGFAEHQEKATYGLGYKSTSNRNKVEAVIDEAGGIAVARIKIDHICWCVPQYTPSIEQQNTMSQHFLSRTPTELRCVERSVLMEEVNNQNLWNLELGSQESMSVPIWIIIGFQQRIGKTVRILIMILFADYLLLVLNVLLEPKNILMRAYR